MNPIRSIREFLRRRFGDSGQAMLEACILIPVLLALFLGLWHHAILSQAQTRSLLAARHVAWARATLAASDSELKKYAAPFFPSNTTLHISATNRTSTYAEFRNMLITYCAVFTIVDHDNQYWVSLSADVPALPFAPRRPRASTTPTSWISSARRPPNRSWSCATTAAKNRRWKSSPCWPSCACARISSSRRG